MRSDDPGTVGGAGGSGVHNQVIPRPHAPAMPADEPSRQPGPAGCAPVQRRPQGRNGPPPIPPAGLPGLPPAAPATKRLPRRPHPGSGPSRSGLSLPGLRTRMPRPGGSPPLPPSRTRPVRPRRNLQHPPARHSLAGPGQGHQPPHRPAAPGRGHRHPASSTSGRATAAGSGRWKSCPSSSPRSRPLPAPPT